MYNKITPESLRIDYEGDNDFLNSVKQYYKAYKNLTHKQVVRAALEMGDTLLNILP